MKKHQGMRVLSLLLAVLCCGGISAAEAEPVYTVYLVRHAEKQLDGSKDPALTQCGQHRASRLAEILANVKLEAVYSSEYSRTLDTAQPTAEQQKLKIIHYNPRELAGMAVTLKAQQRDVLVVGHSDTTAVLAGLLVGEQLAAFDESIYDRIYQAVLTDSGGRIHILQQAFRCDHARE